MKDKRENLSPEQQKVWDHLQRHHRGKAYAEKQRDLAFHCDTNTRTIQSIISELNRKGYPVATTCNRPFGVFVIQTEAERLEYASNLRARRDSINAHWITVMRLKIETQKEEQLSLVGMGT
ncbi:MAG: helix-turn-helix domain-containing protein [Planctomycetota bacterium]|jgi:hypothetical protein